MLPHCDVLIFAEDPGAVNYLTGLPDKLAEIGLRSVFLAQGPALPFLRQCGEEHIPLAAGTTPDELLDKYAPRVVVAGTSENVDSLGLFLIEEARGQGLISFGAVDAFTNADYRFRGRGNHALQYAPEWLLTPDDTTSEAFIALGFPRDRIEVCGHPGYDRVLEETRRLDQEDRTALRARLFPGCGPKTSVAVFVAEISTGLNPRQYRRSEEYTLSGRGKRQGRTEIVMEEFLDAVAALDERPHLVLRLHPKNTLEEFQPLLEEFDQVSQVEPPLELIYAANLVVGMTTSLLAEATVMGRPTLSIIPKPGEKKWLPSMVWDSIPRAAAREELRQLLPSLLKDGAPAFARLQSPQGGTHKRVARILAERIEAEAKNRRTRFINT